MGLVEDIKFNVENGDFKGALLRNGWSDEEIEWLVAHISWGE